SSAFTPTSRSPLSCLVIVTPAFASACANPSPASAPTPRKVEVLLFLKFLFIETAAPAEQPNSALSQSSAILHIPRPILSFLSSGHSFPLGSFSSASSGGGGAGLAYAEQSVPQSLCAGHWK